MVEISDVLNLGVGGIFLWVYVEERKYNKNLTDRLISTLNENTQTFQKFTDKLDEVISKKRFN